MRLRREALALAAVASVTLFLGACATPDPGTGAPSAEASTPRDCEPETGTRVPKSCMKARPTRSAASGTESKAAPATTQ